jgi:hypothetical protein
MSDVVLQSEEKKTESSSKNEKAWNVKTDNFGQVFKKKWNEHSPLTLDTAGGMGFYPKLTTH